MKIEAGGIAPGDIQIERSSKQSTESTSSTQTQSHTDDRTTLSSDTATVKSLVSQALATPDVRQDKVSQLRQALSSGSYKVDTQKLATAIAADSPE